MTHGAIQQTLIQDIIINYLRLSNLNKAKINT